MVKFSILAFKTFTDEILTPFYGEEHEVHVLKKFMLMNIFLIESNKITSCERPAGLAQELILSIK